MYPNRCPHGSVYVRGTQCYLQEAGNNNAQSIASMLNEKWLQDSKNQLEPGLVDDGAGMKSVLTSVQVATEKKKEIVSI